MQTGYIELGLAQQVQPPVVTPNPTKGWVNIGTGNQFFEQLIKIKQGSTTQARCINTRAKFIAGEGFVFEETDKELKSFFDAINEKEDANTVLKKIAKDFALFRGFALQVIWNEAGDSIAEIYYQRFKTVRSGKMNEDEEVEEYWLSRDWAKTAQAKFRPKEIPAFNPSLAKQQKKQLFYYFEENEDVEYYPLPDYWPATDYMELEADLAEFHKMNVQNNFALGNILTVPEEPEATEGKTASEMKQQFLKDFENRFVGPRAKKLMVLFGISGENAAQMLSFVAQNNDTLYGTYTSMCEQKILTANGVTSPVVVGLPGGGSLGGNGNEIRESFEIYYNSEIRPDQKTIIEQFLKLLKYRKGVKLQPSDSKKPVLEIVTTLPVKFTFSETMLQDILPGSRLRAMIDEPDLTDEEKEEMGLAGEENE